jgi:putative ABC transport system ATP-binding protein
MIKLLNVRKGFNIGKPNEFMAVNGITLSMEANRITVFKGPSGSGKTTLLSLIACMVKPTSGRITIHRSGLDGDGTLPSGNAAEIEVTSLPERFLTDIRCKTFGFIFQQLNLIKGISILENVMLPAYPLGEKHGVVQARAQSLLDTFGLRDRASAKVEWLSGGETQRVAMARALMNNPPVIIADEPTAHLDSKLSVKFMEIVSQLKDEGRTAIIASHDPLIYGASMVDRVIVIRDGMIEEDET